MNDCVPNWNMNEDFPSSNICHSSSHIKLEKFLEVHIFHLLLLLFLPQNLYNLHIRWSYRPEGELPELVWRKGHVGLQIRNNHEHEIPIENPSPWMHYETLTRDFCSEPIIINKIIEADDKNCSSNELGSSFGRTVRQMTSSEGHKRKGEEVEESGSHCEDGEFQFLEDVANHRRLVSARRSRDADVHNLSERRRRDRINEKMKALQDLIPQCNKTDKATLLDEAIEYLKSLQLQVQLMWLGSNKTPMVFPNAGPCLSLVGRGIGQVGSLPSSAYVHVQMPRLALPKNHTIPLSATVNQTDASAYQSRFMNHLNFIFPDASLQGSQSVRVSGNLQLPNGTTIDSPDYFDI